MYVSALPLFGSPSAAWASLPEVEELFNPMESGVLVAANSALLRHHLAF
jgi:hypothetical protein